MSCVCECVAQWPTFTTDIFIRKSTEYTLYPYFHKIFELTPFASSWILVALAAFFCILAEGFFIPFHWAFVTDKVYPVDYKTVWMRLAIIVEVIPLTLVHILTKPFNMPFEPAGLPLWEWFTYLHYVAHVLHALHVARGGDTPKLFIRPGLEEEFPGRKWVFMDATVHTVNALRFVTVGHPYMAVYTFVFWVSLLRSIDHRSFIRENPSPNEHKNTWVPNPYAKPKVKAVVKDDYQPVLVADFGGVKDEISTEESQSRMVFAKDELFDLPTVTQAAKDKAI